MDNSRHHEDEMRAIQFALILHLGLLWRATAVRSIRYNAASRSPRLRLSSGKFTCRSSTNVNYNAINTNCYAEAVFISPKNYYLSSIARRMTGYLPLMKRFLEWGCNYHLFFFCEEKDEEEDVTLSPPTFKEVNVSKLITSAPRIHHMILRTRLSDSPLQALRIAFRFLLH